MKSFKGKKIVVMGLGLHGGGAGVAEFFARKGAKVLITDLKSEGDLEKSISRLRHFKNVSFKLGGHDISDFKNADLVVKNPAVPFSSPYIRAAKKAGVFVETDIDLFLKMCPAKAVGITGTKGKSTVSSLTHQIVKKSYPKAILAGNIGISPLQIADKVKKDSPVILELSSFELEGLHRSPEVAVITSLMPDHLDRYKTMAAYRLAKASVFRFQKKSGILILNGDDKGSAVFAKSAPGRVLFFSAVKKPKKAGAYIDGANIYFGDESKPVAPVASLKIYGRHNISNALAAITAAKVLNIENQVIAKSLKRFSGVPYRQELVLTHNGVKYFNDTSATMPEAAIAAIRTLKDRFPESRLILIAGGVDKGLEYGKLIEEIGRNVEKLILLPGTASDIIKKEVDGKKVFSVFSMEEAVSSAAASAGSGDIVVLSPAAASFNLFKNEFDRGDRFNQSVQNLR